MSVKTASKLVTRVMRAAFKETISPANQGSKADTDNHPLSEVGKVSRHFGHDLYVQQSAYSGSVDEFGCPGNTVDSWRLQFSRRAVGFEAANSAGQAKKRRG